jgi:hypothetical protein
MLVPEIQIEGSAFETHQQRPQIWVDGAPLLLPCQDLGLWVLVAGDCSSVRRCGRGLSGCIAEIIF